MRTTETPDQTSFLPHIDVLLQSLRISRDRLNSRSKVAIDTRLLRALLQSLVRQMPFDPAFYIAENADIAAAFEAGGITDLPAMATRSRWPSIRSSSRSSFTRQMPARFLPSGTGAIR